MRVLTDKELDEFIEDVDRKVSGESCGDDWWNYDFFEEAKAIGEDLKKRRGDGNCYACAMDRPLKCEEHS